MKSLLTCLIACSAVLLSACSSYNANLSTTSGQTAATVDNPTGIVSGMTVTSANVETGTKVADISGSALHLSLTATDTGTATAKFSPTVQTVAQQFKNDTIAYGQTLGSMLQTGLKDVSASAPTLAALTSFANSEAQAWGLVPVNSQQQATFNSVLATINKVGSNASTISTFLTGLQTTGTVASTTSTSAAKPSSTTLWRDSKRETLEA